MASLVAAWQGLIETALNQRQVQFVTYPVLNGQGKLIHFEAPARMQNTKSSLWMSAQEFMPWASRLGLTERNDVAVFDCALDWLETNEGPICLNVPPQSVCDPVLTARYYRALKRSPQVASRIWIDIPEFVAYRHAREFRVFCYTLKSLDIDRKDKGIFVEEDFEIHELYAICPNGARLNRKPHVFVRGSSEQWRYQAKKSDCQGCPLRNRCTMG